MSDKADESFGSFMDVMTEKFGKDWGSKEYCKKDILKLAEAVFQSQEKLKAKDEQIKELLEFIKQETGEDYYEN